MAVTASSAWGLGALYGLLSMRDAEAAKPDGVPIEVTAIASVSGGSLTNGVVAQELHARGEGFAAVALDDFRAFTADLLATVATKGLIPAKGRTSRYVAAAGGRCSPSRSAAFVALTVAMFTAARGTPGFAYLLPIWLGVGALLGLLVAIRLRHWWPFVAVLFVAAAGALTWGFLGDTRGDAAWIAVAALVVGTLFLAMLVVAMVSRRGRVLEHALDRSHFDGATLADLDTADVPARLATSFCATELQSGHQCFLSPEIVTEWNAGEGTPGRHPPVDRGAGLGRAAARLPARRPRARRARGAAGPPVEPGR